MFRKSFGLNIRGFVFKVGFLVEKLPEVHFIASVMEPNDYDEERFDTAEAARHWAQSRCTWKTGIDGIERQYTIRWYRGEETDVVESCIVESARVVLINRVL